jgi:hypothetical protein
MPAKNSREVVQKIINAVEHPDNPERKAVLATQNTKEQKLRQSEPVVILIFRLLFIALLVALLINAWSYKGTVQLRWASLIFGLLAGVIVCIAIERKKPQSQKKTLSPSAVLIVGISLMTINLLVIKFKPLVPPSVLTSMTILGISFLLIISVYAFILYWRTMKKVEPENTTAS